MGLRHDAGSRIRAQLRACCAGCGKFIDGKYVVANCDKYHSACFVCNECGATLEGGFVLSLDGRPFCGKHVSKATATPKAVASQGAAAAGAASTAAASRAKAAAQAAEAATGGDGFTIDIRTGEKVYVESGTKRKYR